MKNCHGQRMADFHHGNGAMPMYGILALVAYDASKQEAANCTSVRTALRVEDFRNMSNWRNSAITPD
jgi:hypothetical protein